MSYGCQLRKLTSPRIMGVGTYPALPKMQRARWSAFVRPGLPGSCRKDVSRYFLIMRGCSQAWLLPTNSRTSSANVVDRRPVMITVITRLFQCGILAIEGWSDECQWPIQRTLHRMTIHLIINRYENRPAEGSLHTPLRRFLPVSGDAEQPGIFLSELLMCAEYFRTGPQGSPTLVHVTVRVGSCGIPPSQMRNSYHAFSEPHRFVKQILWITSAFHPSLL
ncbi:hypothetical protein C8Q74DRAFT_1040906 [Fomes fomentarius]|nr:hypothetical protein C8Q74DRAFT_1040906 [Fomes fomentarius]